LCDDGEGGGSCGAEEKGEKCDLEPLKNHAKAHTAYKSVKLFFHMHRIIGHDTEKVWNLQRYSLIWNVQMSICTFVWGNISLHTGINIRGPTVK
jgi:hypothetical protein